MQPYIFTEILALSEICRGKEADQMLSSLARILSAWKRSEAVRRELSHLSDRELADIGITRSDIDRIVHEDAHS
jgi:uncharacterized protein YjiS (DUF1127 family)